MPNVLNETKSAYRKIKSNKGLRNRHNKSSYVQHNKYIPYFFLSPFMILFLVLSLLPILFSFVLSFAQWDGISQLQWVGLKNYKDLFQDKIFLLSIKNTVLIIVYFLPVILCVGLALAYILHMGFIKGKNFFQALLFLPYITTPVAIGILFAVLFDTNYGLLNAILERVDLISMPIKWLEDPQYSKPLIALILNWKYLGYIMVLIMAGLKSIPREIFESAYIDGASAVTCFWKITLPLLRPIITFIVVTSIIGGFQLFDEPLLLFQSGGGGATTMGGPDRAAMTVIMYLYQSAFEFYKWGYAAAMGYVLAFIIFIFSMVMLKLLSPKKEAS